MVKRKRSIKRYELFVFERVFERKKERPIEHYPNISGNTSTKEPRPLTRCYWEIRHGVRIPGTNIHRTRQFTFWSSFRSQ
jgi:hypothetical protein